VFALPEPQRMGASENHWPAKGALIVLKAHVEHMLRAEGF
jgi:hypothetical protein